jgi:hypothetical protein
MALLEKSINQRSLSTMPKRKLPYQASWMIRASHLMLPA